MTKQKSTNHLNTNIPKTSVREKIAKIWQPKYMRRPLIYKIYTKIIFMLILCLAWEKFLDEGTKGIGYAFLSVGIITAILSWFNYLALDDVRIGHLMMGWQKKKPNTVHWNKDIADFIDEEVTDFDELHDDEKTVIRLFSNLAAGGIFILLGLFF